MLPSHLKNAPPPDNDAIRHNALLTAAIAGEIERAGGWLSFARFMELALHAPGLGYYSAGAAKFGADGDFVTAPGLGKLFGRTLARQIAQILADVPDVLELGAGTGKLACDVLRELASLEQLPRRYKILETSADLRARQQDLLRRELPQLVGRVEWLDALPESLEACVIANEVLDAMPVHVVEATAEGIEERGVTWIDSRFHWANRPAAGNVLAAASALQLPSGYVTELNLAASGFMAELGRSLVKGAALLIDYGFPAREFYHPQRSRGTLMCHYRHHAHDDPLSLVGLQDITAHVDFTAVAHAALDAHLEVLGYASQTQFLIKIGRAHV